MDLSSQPTGDTKSPMASSLGSCEALWCDPIDPLDSQEVGLAYPPDNVYGPRQDPKSPYSGVISIFSDRLRRHVPALFRGYRIRIAQMVAQRPIEMSVITDIAQLLGRVSLFILPNL